MTRKGFQGNNTIGATRRKLTKRSVLIERMISIKQKEATSIKDIDKDMSFEEAKRHVTDMCGFIDATLSRKITNEVIDER